MPQQSPIPFQRFTKNVLIINSNEAMQNQRASVLRSHGVAVHLAKNLGEAELLWVPDFFDLVLLDVRQRSKEAVAFWRTIRRQHPRQRISFLVGAANVSISYLRRRDHCHQQGSRRLGAKAKTLACRIGLIVE